MGKTTLILGAGASHIYGYPLGIPLVDKIKEKLRKANDPTGNGLLEDLKALNPYSIDAFLNSKSKHTDIAKAIIAEILLEYEHEHTFEVVSASIDLYRYLYNTIGPENLKNYNIITFNYDRSLEFYFARALSHQYDCTPSEAFAKLSALKIIHIHGRLPFLEGENTERPIVDDLLNYGGFNKHILSSSSHHPQFIDEYKRQIYKHGTSTFRTVYEGSAPNTQAAHLLYGSSRIFFLGFSYNELNMNILGYDFSNTGQKKLIAGTAQGISRIPLNSLHAKYPAIIFQDCSCLDLFLHHYPIINVI